APVARRAGTAGNGIPTCSNTARAGTMITLYRSSHCTQSVICGPSPRRHDGSCTGLFDPVADPLVIEISLERGQCAGWNAPERAPFAMGELQTSREARRGGIAKEGIAKPSVHDQLPERLFHGLPTHRAPHRVGASGRPVQSASVRLQPPPSVL